MTDRKIQLAEHLRKTKTDFLEGILKEATLKDAHLYCILNGLSAQQYGPLLERYIITKYGYKKQSASDCKGDCTKSGRNVEVKASLGGSNHTKYNYVQIRPSHDIHDYLLTAYHLTLQNVESEGELYVFRIPKDSMKELIVSHGGYAHGTESKLGPITWETMQDQEYALRPSFGSPCWKALLAFRLEEPENQL